MSAASKVSRKLSSIAASWPTDPFRPNLQLKNFLQSLSTHPNLTPKAVDAVDALKSNVIITKVQILPRECLGTLVMISHGIDMCFF